MLTLDTGRVSPQFHVIHDAFFEMNTLNDKIHTNWKRLAGFALVQLTVPSTPSITPPLLIFPLGSDPLPFTHQDPEEYMPPPDTNMEPPEDPPPESPDVPPPQLRRSARTRQPTRVMVKSVAQHDIEFHDFYGDTYTPMTIAFNAEHQAYYESMHEDDYKLQNELEDPIAFLDSTAKDILYYHQAMKAPDRNSFQRAMHKEFDDHTSRQYWELLPIDQASEGKKVMDSVWAMKRKRNIVTNEIYKWKARLNLHGGQQEYAVNFYEIFSPVVSWIATRLLLIHSIIYKWHT